MTARKVITAGAAAFAFGIAGSQASAVVLFSDTFTATDGTLLSAHTADFGGGYAVFATKGYAPVIQGGKAVIGSDGLENDNIRTADLGNNVAAYVRMDITIDGLGNTGYGTGGGSAVLNDGTNYNRAMGALMAGAYSNGNDNFGFDVDEGEPNVDIFINQGSSDSQYVDGNFEEGDTFTMIYGNDGTNEYLFINPLGTDTLLDADVIAATADTGGGNQNTAFLFASWASGFGYSVDNLVIGTEAVDVGLAVPEPASLALLGLGGLAMLGRRRKQA